MTGALFGRSYHEVEQELLYCRQFILGPAFVEVMPGWRYIDKVAGLKLSIHPEVDVVQVASADRELTLIGEVLDSTAPGKSNRDILLDLVDRTRDLADLVGESGRFAGRWIILAAFGDERYLIHDALGLRQVFYTNVDVTGALWMVSQPGLATRWLRLAPDAAAERFMDAHSVRIRDEYSWPAAGTPLRGLLHLLPNRCLDLRTGRSQRCWPVAPIGARSAKTAEVFLVERLSNIVLAAARRYPLAIGLTAGIDSRIVMAASRALCGEVDSVTVRQRKMNDDHPDIAVAGRLSVRHGRRHVVVKPKVSMSPRFAALFKDNVYMATDVYGPDAEALISRLQRRYAVMTGSAAEIGQGYYRDKLPGNRYNGPLEAADLAGLQHMEDQPFALRHFQDWLDSAVQRRDVQLLDLFYWENSHGNWLAMTQLQFDIAWREIFTPYNCRDVLEAFLAVDEKERIPPRYTLYKNAR
jgi:hypothetical protein